MKNFIFLVPVKNVLGSSILYYWLLKRFIHQNAYKDLQFCQSRGLIKLLLLCKHKERFRWHILAITVYMAMLDGICNI